MLSKIAYVERRRAALQRLDIEICRLTDSAEFVAADIAHEYQSAIRGLMLTRDRANDSLGRLAIMGDNGWRSQQQTIELENDWTELRSAVLVAIAATYSERVES